MLTVMCPNCRHRFPAPGCCNPGPQGNAATSGGGDNGLIMQKTDWPSNGSFYGGGYLLVPREYSSNPGACFINAPTIIHGPTIIQQPAMTHKIVDPQTVFTNENATWKSYNRESSYGNTEGMNPEGPPSNHSRIQSTDLLKSSRMTDCHINTTCDLTGGTVTITTPSIQSGGCLIQSTDSGIFVQAPRIEIRPKLSGGGCFVEKRLSTEDEETSRVIYRNGGRAENLQTGSNIFFEDSSNFDRICVVPPSGCQELPGMRRCQSMKSNSEIQGVLDTDSLAKNSKPNGQSGPTVVAGANAESDCRRHTAHRDSYLSQRRDSFCDSALGSEMKKRNSICCCGGGVNAATRDEAPRCPNLNANRPISSTLAATEGVETTKNSAPIDNTGAMEIRVNATVQLPPNIGHCTVNITATTGNHESAESCRLENDIGGRARNNFNGGGLVQVDANLGGALGGNNDTTMDRREEAPTTPLSWLTPCPWGFENYFQDKDYTRIAEVKRLLNISGWYHEGLSWQQSENLLKNAPVGSWLMRDSSDSRFVFAVSVQTTRGPTSVRVHYYLGKFRLDAEPRLSHAMPVFDCPMKMLEHYVNYSARIDEHRKEVWVDYSGQIYSQIYLTKPLVKDVGSLSHLARLAVNRNKLTTDHLPPLIKNYLAEYPYSL